VTYFPVQMLNTYLCWWHFRETVGQFAGSGSKQTGSHSSLTGT